MYDRICVLETPHLLWFMGWFHLLLRLPICVILSEAVTDWSSFLILRFRHYLNKDPNALWHYGDKTDPYFIAYRCSQQHLCILAFPAISFSKNASISSKFASEHMQFSEQSFQPFIAALCLCTKTEMMSLILKTALKYSFTSLST